MPTTVKRIRALAAAGVLAVTLGAPTAATAVTIESKSGTSVQGEEITPSGSVSPAGTVAPAAAANVVGETVAANGLAVTGTDIAGMAALGAVSIGAGVLLLAGRRRRAES